MSGLDSQQVPERVLRKGAPPKPWNSSAERLAQRPLEVRPPVLAPPRHRCSLRRLMPIPGGYFFRVRVSVANGEAFPDRSTLSIAHDHVSVARSYAKVA